MGVIKFLKWISDIMISTKWIDWDKLRTQVKKEAKEFIEASELDQVWYIGGEIVSSALICGAWSDDIKTVCEWVIVNGKGMQPELAQHLIDKNT
jgi:hypothetical protein